MHPKNISIQDFTYSLPVEKIANYPLEERDASKLLIYHKSSIKEDIYRNIADHLPAKSLLVFNNTKVIEARILFRKPTGGIIEIFCLEPSPQYPDITTAMSQTSSVRWQCLIGGASKWKPGQLLEKKIPAVKEEIIVTAKFLGKISDTFSIELSWQPAHLSFAEVLHYAGAIPLPPYIKREAENSDNERYQTIYAHTDGSVAAPTAGLHFTENIFESLNKKNIRSEFITLHVGAGTFKPVKAELMQDHEMHAEFIDVSRDSIVSLLENEKNMIIPVGTTALRTIESLYWMGVKVSQNPTIENPELSQWEVYDKSDEGISYVASLNSLLAWMDKKRMQRLITRTQILIAPGYKPKIAAALITNFHQPESTLLLLIAALVGDDWRKIYTHALNNNYRFLSYGDGCLLFFK